MSKITRNILVHSLILLFLMLNASNSFGSESTESIIDMEQSRIRYNLIGFNNYKSMLFASDDNFSDDDSEDNKNMSSEDKIKSPAKAFLLSMAIPGLGQYYNGSRIKPVAFLGVEVTSWILNVKFNNEGDDITDEFQTFQQNNWSRDD